MKKLIQLDHYYSPFEFEDQIRIFVDYYNHRYHEVWNNVTFADVYHGYYVEILTGVNRLNKQQYYYEESRIVL